MVSRKQSNLHRTLIFTYLTDAFVQNDIQVRIKEQGQTVFLEQMGLRNLTQGPSSDITLTARGFEPMTYHRDKILNGRPTHSLLEMKPRCRQYLGPVVAR